MPTRLTELTAATSIAPDDLLYAVVGGNSRRITAAALAGRNRIINGQGRINQRGYVSGTNTTGANQYTLDRWRVVTSGQNLIFTGNDAGRTMTAPAGGVEQVIEGANIEGGTYVLNWTGTATATVNGVARTKGETFTLPANTNATVRFASGTFTDVQLELGSLATVFERLPFGQELRNCQRFYTKSYNLSVVPGTVTDLGAYYARVTTTNSNNPVSLPVEMRVAPAVTIYNPTTGLAGTARNGSRSTNDPMTALSIGSRGFYGSGIGHTAAADSINFHWVADAEI